MRIIDFEQALNVKHFFKKQRQKVAKLESLTLKKSVPSNYTFKV